MSKSGDYTRVCQNCEMSWLLPKEWATEKPPRVGQVKASQRATKFAVGRQRERYSMQASTLQGSQDRVLTNARCPNCGSTSYKQYKPGEAVPAPVSPPPPPQQTPVSPPPPAAPPHWAADPLGRHEQRYWDGSRWTEHVSNAGVAGIDPRS